jgi:glycerophosphoryl diester phosphodiesterase
MRQSLCALLVLVSSLPAFGFHPIVIAHRGASGYLPEHTLEAKAFAHAQKPDFLEQDVALTRDDVPVIIHDHYLDTVTDVARVFPGRARKDGRYYAIDFTAAEVARLTVHERIDLATGKAVYPKRFPVTTALPLRIPTLEQEITFIEGLNRSTGREVGLYSELKVPWFHRAEGHDIERAVLDVFRRHGYLKRGANAYIQCFDPSSLKRLHAMGVPLPLVQLIGHNEWNETPDCDYDAMLTPAGLAKIATYAQGIGPSIDQLAVLRGGRVVLRTDLVRRAHELGLVLHPYTVRVDELPPGVPSPDRVLDILFVGLGVDGTFSDFPDVAVEYLRRKGLR